MDGVPTEHACLFKTENSPPLHSFGHLNPMLEKLALLASIHHDVNIYIVLLLYTVHVLELMFRSALTTPKCPDSSHIYHYTGNQLQKKD